MRFTVLLLCNILFLNFSTSVNGSLGTIGKIIKIPIRIIKDIIDPILGDGRVEVDVQGGIGSGIFQGSVKGENSKIYITCPTNQEYRAMRCEKVCNVNLACVQYQRSVREKRDVGGNVYLDFGQSEVRPNAKVRGCYCRKGFVLNNLEDRKCVPESKCKQVVNLSQLANAYEQKYGEPLPDDVEDLLEEAAVAHPF